MVAYRADKPFLPLFDTLIDGALLKAIEIHKYFKLTILKGIIHLAVKKLNKDQNHILKQIIFMQQYDGLKKMSDEELHRYKIYIEDISNRAEGIVAKLSALKNNSKELDALYTTSLKLETELAFLQARL